MTPHVYYKFLVGSLGLIGALAMFACVIMVFTAADIVDVRGPLGNLGTIFGVGAFVGIILEIPLIIAAFSPRDATYLLDAILVITILLASAIVFEFIPSTRFWRRLRPKKKQAKSTENNDTHIKMYRLRIEILLSECFHNQLETLLSSSGK